MRPVKQTSELTRILQLPRRPADGGPDLPQLTSMLTDALKTPGGTMTLRPIQAFALAELYENQGLFGPIGVGQGKALITLLAGVVLNATRPVLFVPAGLRDQTERDVIPKMSKHWRLHRNLTILSYETLHSPKSSALLEELKPDLIILDEAQALKNPQATRTGRFFRYMKAHPETKLVALSGTMTTKSLFDFSELLKLALPGFKSPVPLHWSILKEWDAAIGAGTSWAHDEPMAPGALRALCAPGENVRQGFRRRLTETPGVVATRESAVDTPIVIRSCGLEVPKVITDALTDLRKNMRTAWGEEIEDGVALARHAAQLSQGFYYRWDWGPKGPDLEWLYARADWHREVRHHIKRNIPGCDSPFLVGAAIARGDLESEAYAPWCAVRDRYLPHPPVATVWLSDFLVVEILRWLREPNENGPGIAWYQHRAIGARLEKLGVKVFKAGKEDARVIIDYPAGPIACAMKPNSEGKNLQDRWSRNLVVSCPPSAKMWQQMVGRTHRTGQNASVVEVDLLQHTKELRESWAEALRLAEYAQDMTDPSKLLMAEHIGFKAA